MSKKIFSIVTTIAVLSASLLSCKKDQTFSNIDSKTNQRSVSRFGTGAIPMAINAVYAPSKHDCDPWMRINCCILDPVVVSPRVTAVLQGGAVINPSVVSGVFMDQLNANLCNALGAELTSALQSGSYFVKEVSSKSSYSTFIAGQVADLNEQNMEFAFTINK